MNTDRNRITDRLERDLNQIADRATPSSTAWEAIRQRIDEQDTRASSGTESTMEVIMLSPDRNEPRNRSRTWMAVAASVAALALVGGLIVAANRDSDDNVPADQPIVTVPDTTGVDGETAPAPDAEATIDPDTQQAEPEAGPDGSVQLDTLPAVAPVLATSGTLNATCGFGAQANAPGRINTEQTCRFDESENPPFDATQEITLSQLTRVQLESAGAGAFVSISDSGYLTAGVSYDSGGIARFVGAVPGTGDYDGESILLSGRGFDNVSAIYDWSVAGEGLPASSEEAEITAEVDVSCTLGNAGFDSDADEITYEQTCTFSGDDPRFVLEPLQGELRQFDSRPDVPGVNAEVGSYTYITAILGDTALLSGVFTSLGEGRFVLIWNGTGELDGSVITGIGSIVTTPDATEADPEQVRVQGTMTVVAETIGS